MQLKVHRSLFPENSFLILNISCKNSPDKLFINSGMARMELFLLCTPRKSLENFAFQNGAALNHSPGKPRYSLTLQTV